MPINEKEINDLTDEYNLLYTQAKLMYKKSFPPEIAILLFIAKALTIIAKEN